MGDGLWRNRSELCPANYFNGSCADDETKLWFSYVPEAVGLASATASVCGCSLMLFAYHRFRDFRTGSRRVATYLALSNLFLGVSSAVGFLNAFFNPGHHSKSPSCSAYSAVCIVQSYTTWTSALASFTWTSILAMYLYLVLVKKSILVANQPRLWVVYWILSVVIPLGALTPIFATGYLGYSPYASGGGCFITTAVFEKDNLTISFQFNQVNTALIVTIKFIEIASYLFVSGVFGSILYHLWKPPPLNLGNKNGHLVQPRVFMNLRRDWKLVIIPGSFIALRIWGTTAIFLSIFFYYNNELTKEGCVSSSVYGVLYALTILQAIGDPGQGWAITILFIFLSPVVRRRLFFRTPDCWRFRLRSHLFLSTDSCYHAFDESEQHPDPIDKPSYVSGRSSKMSSPVSAPRRDSCRSSCVRSVDASDYGVDFPHSPSNIDASP